MKLAVNDKLADRKVLTLYDGEKSLKELVGSGKTAIVFLRYFGCPVCQYELYDYANNYEAIKAVGGEVIVVLQSTPESIKSQCGDMVYPYPVICDPTCAWYDELDIPCAESFESVIAENTMEYLQKAGSMFSHGENEGREMQQPATFIVDSSLCVLEARYSSYLNDFYLGEELPAVLK